MAETKTEISPDAILEAPLTPLPDEADGTDPSSPSKGKSDGYFSRKFGSFLNKSKRLVSEVFRFCQVFII